MVGLHGRVTRPTVSDPRLIRVDLDELEAMIHHVGESSWT
jgi:hypothetical protein